MQDDQELLFQALGGIASRQRIARALRFLLREGYLRVNEKGDLVEDSPLMEAGDGETNRYIRRFHKQALSIARQGIDQYNVNERYANAMVFPLNRSSYQELLAIIEDFAEQLKQFSEKHAQDDERLYQIILNLCPTGGASE